jgi:hypothetical protein
MQHTNAMELVAKNVMTAPGGTPTCIELMGAEKMPINAGDGARTTKRKMWSSLASWQPLPVLQVQRLPKAVFPHSPLDPATLMGKECVSVNTSVRCERRRSNRS